VTLVGQFACIVHVLLVESWLNQSVSRRTSIRRLGYLSGLLRLRVSGAPFTRVLRSSTAATL
jgi:hypothetical protein